VRERGVATNLAEYRPGVNVIAAPILTEDDGVAGSIALAGPEQRLRSEWGEAELDDHLLAAANTIEVNLNFA
jgi:DNA-binding IclR family transcriptional regulator